MIFSSNGELAAPLLASYFNALPPNRRTFQPSDLPVSVVELFQFNNGTVIISVNNNLAQPAGSTFIGTCTFLWIGVKDGTPQTASASSFFELAATPVGSSGGISNVSITSDGHLLISAVDGSTYNAGRVTGLNAYELAVQNGYTGTEAEWLEEIHSGQAGLVIGGYPVNISSLEPGDLLVFEGNSWINQRQSTFITSLDGGFF